MSFINQILNNDTYTTSTLKDMVEQEIDRVISKQLLSKAECLDFLNKYSDFNQNNLLQIYNKLSNIKLAGDKLNDKPIDFKDIMLDKLKEIEAENKPYACKCSNTCGSCSDNKLNKIEETYVMIFDVLEKIAYDLGNNGDQNTAYLVERTLNKIKSDLE